jgi:hypothetical protein
LRDELRALLRAELHAERPPPIGDVVGSALRAGRRKRRNRRLGLGLGLAFLLALAILLSDVVDAARDYLASAAAGNRIKQCSSMSRLSPETVPITTPAPTAVASARTVTTHDGTPRAGGEQKKATSAAMLHLLTERLPVGKTSQYGASAGDDLSVRLCLDTGFGPGMPQVAVGGDA